MQPSISTISRQTRMLRSRFLRTASFPLVTPGRPRLGNPDTLLLQLRSALEYSRPFTNPPKPDVIKTLRKIALAETLRTKGNARLSEAHGLSSSVSAFGVLFLKDVNERYLRDSEWRVLYSIAQQSMEELHQMMKADARRAIPNWTAEERKTLERFLKEHGLIFTRLAFIAEVMTYMTCAYVAYKVC